MLSISTFWPVLAGVLGAVAALALDAWDKRRAAAYAAAAGLVIGALWTAYTVSVLPLLNGFVAGGTVIACLLVPAVVLVGGARALGEQRSGGRLAALAALAACASAVLASAIDLMIVLLGVETLALCGYGIVALGGGARSREAAMKWFIQGAVATALLVAGVAVLLSATGGSLSYPTIAAAADSATRGASSALPFAVGLTLVLAALAFKAGAFPFHSWAPDAYETAPPLGAAVLASAGKIGAISAIAWIAAAGMGVQTPALPQVSVAALAAGSIVFGNMAALRQRSFARLIAYSGIAQVGYALAGLPALAKPLVGAIPAAMLFASLYGVAAAASFLFVEAVRERDPGWDGSIAELAGLSRRSPALAVSLAVIMFSLTGIPLTAGFWGKLLLFGAAALGGWMWLAVVGVLGSVVSFGYYGAVLRAAFFDDSSQETVRERGKAGPATGATVVLAVVLLILGVMPLFTGLGPFLEVLLRR
jgi:NADH-quinone oxidoreductase subunit N